MKVLLSNMLCSACVDSSMKVLLICLLFYVIFVVAFVFYCWSFRKKKLLKMFGHQLKICSLGLGSMYFNVLFSPCWHGLIVNMFGMSLISH